MINPMPYATFEPLPDQEAWIRSERSISMVVSFYVRLKALYGSEKALAWFRDGAGEYLCAKAWVPYYEGSKAFIAYCAWIESRINGENVSIDEFSSSRCVLRFTNHLWMSVYHQASHIKTQISFEEYKDLFEYIWQDRANNAGWSLSFVYSDEDTVLVFGKGTRLL